MLNSEMRFECNTQQNNCQIGRQQCQVSPSMYLREPHAQIKKSGAWVCNYSAECGGVFFPLSTAFPGVLLSLRFAPLLKGPSLTLKDIAWKECVFSICKLRRITMVVMERDLIRKSKVQTGHAGTRELCVKLRSEGVSRFCNHETALCQAKWSRCSQESGSTHAIAAIFAQENCISCTAGR